MTNVRISQLNVEIPVTSDTGDVLHNQAEAIQQIQEKTTTFCAVVVTCINLEIPVGQVAPTPPPVVTPGDTAPSAFTGAPDVKREKIVSFATSDQTLDESIIEVIATYAVSTQIVDTLVHQKIVETTPAPIAGRVPKPEAIRFDTIRASSDAVVPEHPEVSKEKLRQKEEDELILLGILG